ncbi:hypothetical protein SMKI_10G3320 [Saccharomyces mikatae IFO 1815]|uniref:Ubiquitin-conjugating enzyme E2C-binding protein n=1 Tax=Saccharomyces mikatae IFO 1815 TaxID=226126 RepID=A0AA35IRN6_SACMI|nr:uncharacterized protein SMKI_10G3320 [Saccharomyces mikatae IFO 1815]CAI4034539.1 hypothetical protein SMKI_10G3320 [Saccharomyces mikatae IFO 1815]
MVQYVVEWLPRIESISVVVEGWKQVEIRCLKSTLLSISDDEGQVEDISLPVEVKESVNISSKFKNRDKSLEWILKLKSKPSKDYDSSIMSLPDGKWTKEDLHLDSDFSIECLNCKQQIISRYNCQVVNDMPSEFWFELMDYWHCHKPDVKKGKSASYTNFETLKPSRNEILIGSSYFQGTPATLENVIIGKDNVEVLCKKCSVALGQLTVDSLYKLHKWKLQLMRNGNTYKFSPEWDVTLSLINIVKANSCRYALLKSGAELLLVWIFSVDIGVTLTGNRKFKRSMKLLYTKNVTTINQFLERQVVEELNPQETTFKAFYNNLLTVNALLPSNMKKMGEWTISYTSLV